MDMKYSVLCRWAVCAATVIALAGCGRDDKDFDATGTFEATEVTVSAEVSGRILSFAAEEGRSVSAGERLGEIDSVQLYLKKRQLLKSAASVRSGRPDVEKQVASLKEQIAKQKSEKTRVENLLKAKAATQKQLDDVTSAIAVLESQLAATESSLRNNIAGIDAQSSALDIQVAQVDDQLAKCQITTPIDGVVLSKYAQAGELAVTGKPLFKVADVKRMYLRAYFTLEQLKDVKIGQRVSVTADFGGGSERKYEGRIVWISEKSEFTPKSIQTKDDRANLVYAVKVEIENDGYVKIGMYGEVKL